MAATLSGALANYLRGIDALDALNIKRDTADPNVAYPRLLITEGIARIRVARGDHGAAGAIRETCQLDLFERWREKADNGTWRMVEDAALAGELENALAVATLPDAPKRVYGVVVVSSVRTLDRDNNLVRTLITIDIDRDK